MDVEWYLLLILIILAVVLTIYLIVTAVTDYVSRHRKSGLIRRASSVNSARRIGIIPSEAATPNDPRVVASV
jgi:hypothetical protein